MQAKIELALSHNDSIGTNNTEKLAELMTVHNVDTDVIVSALADLFRLDEYSTS